MLGGCKAVSEHNASQEIVQCEGDVTIPGEFSDFFIETNNSELLNLALGEPGKGGLCEGKTYQLKDQQTLIVYRAWNSTNPNSRFGAWWAFYQPDGKVSQYREDYEICYQWSPLDKLVQCQLKPGTQVAIGTGQSAVCSEYLEYPPSDKLQIYLPNAEASVENCTVFDGELSWIQED